MEQEWGEGGGTGKDHRALFPFNTTCYHYFLVLMPSVKTDSWKVEIKNNPLHSIIVLSLYGFARMGEPRDLFKKTRDTKGTFHAKMGSIKDRNGMDLTEAEDIKKSWQEYTEDLYKKDLHDQDNPIV